MSNENKGEPVAWIEIGDLEKIAQGAKWSGTVWGRPADQEGLYKLPLRVPVYTHANPGEVERCEARLHEVSSLCASVEQERDALRAKLAELGALLRDLPAGEISIRFAARIKSALCASAEPSAPIGRCQWCLKLDQPCKGCGPSAPVERDERADFEAHRKSLGLCVKRLAGHPDLYESQAANGGWEAWQARAALEGKNHG